MMSVEEWQVVRFTFFVALISTVINIPIGTFLAWLLARKTWPGKSIVETLVYLPLVMPPVAVGLILLQLLGRRGAIGGFLYRQFDLDIVFTARGVVVALSVMSLPLLVRTARIAFEQVNPRFEQVARTLGATPLRVFWSITLPLAARGIIAGAVLGFARALGEFGATMLVAGSIPGKTETLAVAIYQFIQLGHDQNAFRLLSVSILLSFAAVWASEWFSRMQRRRSE